MKKNNWQLTTPIDAILFDCDGTLSSIEGIDHLADMHGVGDAVKALTEEAMSKTGINSVLYQQRLQLVQPDKQSLHDLGLVYYEHKSPDIEAVIGIFQKFQKPIFVISAGILTAVSDFAKLLRIDEKNVFAVEVYCDEQGHYRDFDHASPLIHNDGKKKIVSEIAAKYKNLAFVGDGMNDLSVLNHVTRFIGYGGAYYRKNIEELCEFYIKTPSLAGLLPLCLTDEEKNLLNKQEMAIYLKGFQSLS